MKGLLVKAQGGDRDAQGRMVEQCMPMIMYEARHFASRRSDVDDYIQEGSIAVLRAISHYNPARGGFMTFARTCVRNAMRTTYSMEKRLPETGLEEDRIADDEETTQVLPPSLRRWLEGLSRIDRQFVYLAFGARDGTKRSPQDLAAIYDCSPWWVYKKLEAIKKDARESVGVG